MRIELIVIYSNFPRLTLSHSAVSTTMRPGGTSYPRPNPLPPLTPINPARPGDTPYPRPTPLPPLTPTTGFEEYALEDILIR
jgi:hypothetical protein